MGWFHGLGPVPARFDSELFLWRPLSSRRFYTAAPRGRNVRFLPLGNPRSVKTDVYPAAPGARYFVALEARKEIPTNQLQRTADSLTELRKQCLQEWVKRGRKRVGHGHPTPRKSVREVFRKEETTAGFRRGGQHNRVPDRKAMIARQICGVNNHSSGRLDHCKGVTPTKHSCPSPNGAPFGLSNKYIEQFA